MEKMEREKGQQEENKEGMEEGRWKEELFEE